MNPPDYSSPSLPAVRPRVFRAALALILVAAALLRCWDLDDSFEFGHQVNGALYCTIAQNYLKFGFAALHLAPVLRGGDQRPEEHVYYLRHPPLCGLLIAVLFKIFHVSHVVARVPFILMSLVALLGVAQLARRLRGERAALIAALFMAVLPGGAFYGSFVDVQGSLVMGFSVLAVIAYLGYHERGDRRALLLSAFLCVLCGLTDWPGYFTLGLLGVHALVYRRRAALGVAAVVIGVVLFALHLLQTRLATGKLGEGGPATLSATLAHHSFYGLVARDGVLGLWSFVVVTAQHLASLLTIPAVGLAAIAAVLCLRARARPDARWGGVLVLLGAALLHILLFAEISMRHDYWVLYMLPPVAIGAATLIARWWEKGGLATRGAALACLATAALGATQSVLLMHKPRPFFKPLGEIMKALTGPADHVLTCELGHAALVFYSDRLLRGKFCDDFFEGVPSDQAIDDPALQQPAAPYLKGMTVAQAFALLKAAKYVIFGERFTRFVVPLQARSYSWHRHDKVVQILRASHPSRIADSVLGPVEVFDLTQGK
ncbi:MAG: glycosyltransferase family 39 protein [Planctomycetota bacterium]